MTKSAAVLAVVAAILVVATAFPVSVRTSAMLAAGKLDAETLKALQAPEQVHAKMIGCPSKMAFSWVTQAPAGSVIKISTEGEDERSIEGSSFVFHNDATDVSYPEGRNFSIHNVVVDGFKPSTVYKYQVGDEEAGMSDTFTLTTLGNGPFTTAIFGDLGYLDAYCLPALHKDFQQGIYDMVIHSGDYAYNLESNDATVGDGFMNQIQDIAASLPYQTCPGNHEVAFNFSNYLGRFHSEDFEGDFYNGNSAMEQLPAKSWFSFDVDSAHFVSISTELYFNNPELIDEQLAWLDKDLAAAQAAGTPWIVVFGHRPFYCSPDDQGLEGSFCRSDADMLRASLEQYFLKYGVTFYFAGHVHSYEATYQVAKGVVASQTFDNPTAPFYIIGGAAGNTEGKINYEGDAPAYSRFRTRAFGYGLLTVHNSTHLEFTQRGIDESVIDHIMVTKL
uniref:Purple acid phosphatase n=1 Tax=Palpitomonas bilix TaxID=652834 RepID=A0A7S3GJ18_9EUKA|mmetsp:Transcript_5591/g.13000  ORF Transcript_5591/g.13000 Transcript_5591/m.13000 type:complete len:447 (+) Transcript_5591:75-1415(+)